jgi:hypothetical protein
MRAILRRPGTRCLASRAYCAPAAGPVKAKSIVQMADQGGHLISAAMAGVQLMPAATGCVQEF